MSCFFVVLHIVGIEILINIFCIDTELSINKNMDILRRYVDDIIDIFLISNFSFLMVSTYFDPKIRKFKKFQE